MSYDYESSLQLFLQPKLGKTFNVKSELVDVPLVKGISWRLQAFKANNDSALFVAVKVADEVDRQKLSFAVRIDVKPKVFSRTSGFFPLDRSRIENNLSEGFQLNGKGNHSFQKVLVANKFVVQIKATLTIKCSRNLFAASLARTEFAKEFTKGFAKEFAASLARTAFADSLAHTAFYNRDLADFTIQIGRDTWKAHKLILSARSPVFRRMLANKECEESKQSHLKIVDVTKDTFEIFFQFLYTSRFPDLSLKQAMNLLILADKYDVQELKNLCDDSLVQLLRETDPVYGIFQFAHDYNCSQELKQKAFGFVKSSIFKKQNLCDELVEKPEQVNKLVKMMAKMAEKKKKFDETLKKMNETVKVAKKRKIQE